MGMVRVQTDDTVLGKAYDSEITKRLIGFLTPYRHRLILAGRNDGRLVPAIPTFDRAFGQLFVLMRRQQRRSRARASTRHPQFGARTPCGRALGV